MRLTTIFTLICFCLSSITLAQTDAEPVRWETQLERLSPTEIRLEFNSIIAKGWHLYSLKEFSDGPLPTEFTFELDSLFVIPKGQMKSTMPTMAYDEVFGFAEYSKVPGKKLRVRVHLEERITRPPHFAPH